MASMIGCVNIVEFSKWEKLFHEFQELNSLLTFNTRVVDRMEQGEKRDLAQQKLDAIELRIEKILVELGNLKKYY